MAKAITKTARFFNGLLSLLIILGFISAGGLFFMGFQKANNAEAEKVKVEKLYEVYGIEYGKVKTSDTIIKELLNNLIPDNIDNKIINTVESALKDDTLPEAIVKTVYSPSGSINSINSINPDGEIKENEATVSSAIAQRILVHRIKKAYDSEELTAILMGIGSY